MNNKQVKKNGMKKIIIGRVFILSYFLAFCSSVSVFADTIDVRITNRYFTGNATSGTLTFDVELRPGPGYASTTANGQWTTMNLCIDIYGESGITYNVPTSSTTTTHNFSGSHNITNDTYVNFSNGLGLIAGVYNTVAIQATRNNTYATDLPPAFRRIANITIPITGGIVTDATILKVRTETVYSIAQRAIWTNAGSPGTNFPFRQILPTTAAMITASPTTICSGDQAVLNVSSTNLLSPATYRLYSSQASVLAIAEGTTTLTTPSVAKTTTFYVSAENADYDENLPGERKPVTVTITPRSIPAMIIVTKQ